MKKLTKILATQLGCEQERAERALSRMQSRIKKRSDRATKKVFDGVSPGDKAVQDMIDSTEESDIFDTMLFVLNELAEDVDVEELEKAYLEERAKKVVN